MVLSQQEIDACREAFCSLDKDRSGTIDVWELRQLLEAMGQLPTEEELFALIAEVDLNMVSHAQGQAEPLGQEFLFNKLRLIIK
mmetsp:Transcript_27014/g.59058  ORF Transcript_27014/g.59058 Transcript_27014/m.59058 type:complete len:84 (+) Transcript_27014:316-567(+)